MKKMTVLLLALMLCFCILGASAFADGTVFSYGYFYYTVADKSITITGYFGDETEVTVPSMIAGIPVNEIAPGAFDGTTVQILHLPDTVTTVPEDAGQDTRIYADAEQSQPETTTPPVSNAGNDRPVQEVVVAEGEPLTPTEETSVTAEQVIVEAPPEKEEPEPSPTPEPTGSPAPEATEEPEATPDTTAEPEETPNLEHKGQNSSAIAWIIGAAVLVCGGAAVIVFRKKGGKA